MTTRYHTTAAIVSTGDEMVLGESLNTNSRLLADRLMAVGVSTVEHVTVGDDRELTAATLRRLAASVSVIITTGGLGPTLDDVMRDALADALGENLVTDDRALSRLEARFASRGRGITENQRLQAKRPASAVCIDNDNGTAPGLHAVVPAGNARDGVGAGGGSGGAECFCLPGPPRELVPMLEAYVVPRLRPPPGRIVRTRFLHTIGLGEGEVATRLGGLLARGRNPIVGITVASAVVTLRVRYVGTDAAEADALVTADEQAVRAALGIHVFGEAEDTFAGVVVRRMAAEQRGLAVVESCTGGLLGEMITEVAGSSAMFRGGWITYSNQMKTAAVGVPEALLAEHGAVSAEVAGAMAVGGLERAWQGQGGDCQAPGPRGRHALAITGIAGPGGGTPEKPVGTVFVAHAWRDRTSAAGPDGHQSPQVETRRLAITGDRTDIRLRAARAALALLYYSLAGAEPLRTPLLWEIAKPPG